MQGVFYGKGKEAFTSLEIEHLRKSIRRHKPIPLKIEHAQRYMLNWLKAWAVIYRQTADLRSYSGSIWLRGIYSTVELDHGEEEQHRILENEHEMEDGSDGEVVETFKRITTLQIEKIHTRLTEDTEPAGTTEADVTGRTTETLALRHRSSSYMQSIEQIDSSPPAQVPTKASRQLSMATSLSAVSRKDHSFGNRNQTAAAADNQVRGAFRELFGIMHRSQTPCSRTLGDTTADAYGAELRPPSAAADTDDIESHGEAVQVMQETGPLPPESFVDIIDLTGHDTVDLTGD